MRVKDDRRVTLQYHKKISRVDQSSTRVKIEGIKILDLINGVYIYIGRPVVKLFLILDLVDQKETVEQ